MRLIDADALLKDIISSADMGGALGKVVECVKYYAKYMVASAPTIEPERKKGEWILQSDDHHEYYECDQCGICVGLFDVRNFCCNCGADMRGEQP